MMLTLVVALHYANSQTNNNHRQLYKIQTYNPDLTTGQVESLVMTYHFTFIKTNTMITQVTNYTIKETKSERFIK